MYVYVYICMYIITITSISVYLERMCVTKNSAKSSNIDRLSTGA